MASLSIHFEDIYKQYALMLLSQKPIKVGKWHQMDVSDNEYLDTAEIVNHGFTLDIPFEVGALQAEIKPNLPWAEDHFKERVSRRALNPPPSEEWWPFAMSGNARHKVGDKFSHTYPERMWAAKDVEGNPFTWRGIRFSVGDLDDLVALLIKEPMTRQAYLPIWFPEDINAANIGERVPCTLGYHFLFRPPTFTITYLIRSCDFVRHFRDDVYMAARLLQWVTLQCMTNDLGGVWSTYFEDNTIPKLQLVFHAMSLHCMRGDIPKIKRELGIDRVPTT